MASEMPHAMMSDRTARFSWTVPLAICAGCGSEITELANDAGLDDLCEACAAEREARAMLAKTECINPAAGIYGETISLSTLHDGLKCLRGVPGKRFTIRTEEAQIVVESLSAFISADDPVAFLIAAKDRS